MKAEVRMVSVVGLLALSLSFGAHVHAELPQTHTKTQVAIFEVADAAEDDESQPLLPGTEAIAPDRNSVILCRGAPWPGQRNSCIEIGYPLLGLPILNGLIFLGLLAVKKRMDAQEEQRPKK
eukprot:CAMPEP_0179441618 /NCGR_PEP_ID=MMETSP0799-20121207/25144_1 /TAXON_ID=46947 /ORGANISM="Geminigera cryophila, Strain CCMP2564" /LENGTH=121 /DNA_ID=CAMNT_0021226001 /DNA_START=77 /DNA_END=442 /DNA_ORIENTATION=-